MKDTKTIANEVPKPVLNLFKDATPKATTQDKKPKTLTEPEEPLEKPKKSCCVIL